MSKREVIEPHKGDKRYAGGTKRGSSRTSQVNVGTSLARTGAANRKQSCLKDRATAAIRRRAEGHPEGSGGGQLVS